MKLILLFIPLCFILCCNNKEFLKNQYFIDSISYNVIDYLGKDSEGFIYYEKFNKLNKNEYSGICLEINKQFISDSLIEIGLFSSYRPNGLNGKVDSILKLKLFVDEEQIEISDSLIGIDILHSQNIPLQIIPKSQKSFISNCSNFKKLTDFKTHYNSNDISIVGNETPLIMYFWFKKSFLITNHKLVLNFETNQLKKKYEVILN